MWEIADVAIESSEGSRRRHRAPRPGRLDQGRRSAGPVRGSPVQRFDPCCRSAGDSGSPGSDSTGRHTERHRYGRSTRARPRAGEPSRAPLEPFCGAPAYAERGRGRTCANPAQTFISAGFECRRVPSFLRRVWDSNPRDISAHWFSRPGPSAARTTLPRTPHAASIERRPLYPTTQATFSPRRFREREGSLPRHPRERMS